MYNHYTVPSLIPSSSSSSISFDCSCGYLVVLVVVFLSFPFVFSHGFACFSLCYNTHILIVFFLPLLLFWSRCSRLWFIFPFFFFWGKTYGCLYLPMENSWWVSRVWFEEFGVCILVLNHIAKAVEIYSKALEQQQRKERNFMRRRGLDEQGYKEKNPMYD